MTVLENEIAEFTARRDWLEAEHRGEWVLIVGRRIEGVYPRFDAAAHDAVERFGGGPYLIREIGAEPIAPSRVKLATL